MMTFCPWSMEESKTMMIVGQMMSLSMPAILHHQQAIKAVRVLQSYYDSKGSEEGTWTLIGIDKIVTYSTKPSAELIVKLFPM